MSPLKFLAVVEIWMDGVLTRLKMSKITVLPAKDQQGLLLEHVLEDLGLDSLLLGRKMSTLGLGH